MDLEGKLAEMSLSRITTMLNLIRNEIIIKSSYELGLIPKEQYRDYISKELEAIGDE